jgi:hypothetical protein
MKIRVFSFFQAFKDKILSYLYKVGKIMHSNHSKQVIFSIDAETVGLYGEPFAAAYVIYNMECQELEKGYFACPLKKLKDYHQIESGSLRM